MYEPFWPLHAAEAPSVDPETAMWRLANTPGRRIACADKAHESLSIETVVCLCAVTGIASGTASGENRVSLHGKHSVTMDFFA
jgi:hypothetical protein